MHKPNSIGDEVTFVADYEAFPGGPHAAQGHLTEVIAITDHACLVMTSIGEDIDTTPSWVPIDVLAGPRRYDYYQPGLSIEWGTNRILEIDFFDSYAHTSVESGDDEYGACPTSTWLDEILNWEQGRRRDPVKSLRNLADEIERQRQEYEFTIDDVLTALEGTVNLEVVEALSRFDDANVYVAETGGGCDYPALWVNGEMEIIVSGEGGETVHSWFGVETVVVGFAYQGDDERLATLSEATAIKVPKSAGATGIVDAVHQVLQTVGSLPPLLEFDFEGPHD